MRLPNAAHRSHPWRIREVASDFTLEDVWALPVHGGPEDFPELIALGSSLDPANADSLPTRALWRLRDLLGKWFDLGRVTPTEGDDAVQPLPIPGTHETSLAERLPDDLRGTTANLPPVDFQMFTPIYVTDDEFAAELSNKTMHGVLHLGWVEQGDDRYQGQMAVYVKPRGPFGEGYMTLIKPFRHWIVYPALMRQFEQTWARRVRQ
jgi:Protein of unknown function (DUF2867)